MTQATRDHLRRLAAKYDSLPAARLTGRVVTTEPEEDTLATEFLKTLGACDAEIEPDLEYGRR